MDKQLTIDKYLEDLIMTDGADFTDEQKQGLKLELLNELEKRLKIVSLENLDASGVQKFAEAVAGGEFDLLAQIKFFSDNISGYDQIMQQALEEFKQEYLSL